MACSVLGGVGFNPLSLVASHGSRNDKGAKVKIDKPDKFEGNPAELSNWLFAV